MAAVQKGGQASPGASHGEGVQVHLGQGRPSACSTTTTLQTPPPAGAHARAVAELGGQTLGSAQTRARLPAHCDSQYVLRRDSPDILRDRGGWVGGLPARGDLHLFHLLTNMVMMPRLSEAARSPGLSPQTSECSNASGLSRACCLRPPLGDLIPGLGRPLCAGDFQSSS